MSTQQGKTTMHNTPLASFSSIDDPQLPVEVIRVIKDRLGDIPSSGIAAGQAVASAIFYLLGRHDGVFNDIDVFLPKSSDIDKLMGESWNPKLRADNDLVTLTHGYRETGFSSPVFKKGHYYIIGSCYLGNVNIVVVENFNHSQIGAQDIIGGFDINACEAAIDLESMTLTVSDAFRDFIKHWVLDVTTYHTPAHTALRIARKSRALNARVNSTVMLRLQTMLAIAEAEERHYSLNYTRGMLMAEKNAEKAANEPLVCEHFTFRDVTIQIPMEEEEEEFMTLMQLSPKACHDGVVGAYMSVISFLGAPDFSVAAAIFPYLWDRVANKGDDSAVKWLIKEATARDAMKRDWLSRPQSEEEEAIYAEACERGERRDALLLIFICALRHHNPRVFKSQSTCINRALKMAEKHPLAFSKNEKHLTSLDDAILFGKNLNWLEKKRLHLVIGMYEDNAALLPSLSSRQYKAALTPILDAIFSRMENERVTPIGYKLISALNATGKIKVTELTSELEMLEQGYAQKHCVGGYFHQVKSRQCIILDVLTPEDKKYTVEYRVITRDGEFGFTKNQCKGVNNRPMPQEIKKLLPEFFSDNGHEKEWFLKNTYASQRGLQGNEIDFDYDDDIPF